MVEDYVWISSIFKFAQLNRRWEVDVYHEGRAGDGSVLFLNKNGKPIEQDLLPKKIWANPDDPPINILPPVFDIGYAILVRADIVEIFPDIQMGQGAILPLSEGIFQSDQLERVNESYACWTIGNSKNAVQLDETVSKKKLSRMSKAWHLETGRGLKDFSVVVSRAALSGPDQWIDPNLQGSLFLSRNFGDALVAAGLKDAFFLHRCKVIDVKDGVEHG